MNSCWCLLVWFTVLMTEKETGFSSEDEVEAPDFYNEGNVNRGYDVTGVSTSLKRNDSIHVSDAWRYKTKDGREMLCESIVTGDTASKNPRLHTRGKAIQIESCTTSATDKETIRLDQWSEIDWWATHQPSNRKDKIACKGSRRKTIAKSSCHVESDKKRTFRSTVQKNKDQNSDCSDELLDESAAIDSCPKDKLDHITDSDDDQLNSRLALSPVQRGDCGSSMVELLDDLQGRNSKPHVKCRKGAGRKERTKSLAAIRRRSLFRRISMSDEDPAEFMESGSSTDNEDIARIPAPAIVESEKKTMADKFQEAFGCAPVQEIRSSFIVPKQTSGLFGRLQQVMQRQREQDTEFLKKLQTEVWPKDEARCIDVKVLTKSFDAKLTVCHCSVLENEESSIQNPQLESFGKSWTIIFNSRVCGDVDLEVGNLIRIHPPWKEVQVLRCGEVVILTTYFSQI